MDRSPLDFFVVCCLTTTAQSLDPSHLSSTHRLSRILANDAQPTFNGFHPTPRRYRCDSSNLLHPLQSEPQQYHITAGAKLSAHRATSAHLQTTHGVERHAHSTGLRPSTHVKRLCHQKHVD